MNTGGQPKTFQGMGGFTESEGFTKHFVKSKNKLSELFLLDTLKTTF